MTDHGLHYVLPVAVLLMGACGKEAAGPQALAAVMIGEWRYARPAPLSEVPTLNAGLFVTIAVDSAVSSRFWGRVTSWFVGDMGLPLDRFGPVTGDVDDAHGVTLRIASNTTAMSAHTVRGQVNEDILVVLESWAGVNVGPFPVGGLFQRIHDPHRRP